MMTHFLSHPVIVTGLQSDLARVSGLALREAEDFLDWLEQHGSQSGSLVCEANELFAVEFRLTNDIHKVLKDLITRVDRVSI
jgi:hypothetical protein